jgi:hypothetical protein
MARADQFLRDSKAYKSRRSRNENKHILILSGLTKLLQSAKTEIVSVSLD